ncbi:MAG: hypothetical protein PW789_11940 [Edaphobacter sp.]|uniref:hypothetical protein n=1 Tax=Edaphobacter sp. TaxID=1934404 RepID=UPI002384726C|nr:hypothetical protein [Edaphobacter sp.]MDE1177296.1 hypothetical protein [Edaphobacter sp.]
MTTQIRGFFQALFATFDHSSDLSWTTINGSMTTAMFCATGMNVTVRFSPMNARCLVDYQITGTSLTTTDCVRSSLSVYNGVLQALRMFHRVHGPVAYRFASDDEALAELWNAYMQHSQPMSWENKAFLQ